MDTPRCEKKQMFQQLASTCVDAVNSPTVSISTTCEALQMLLAVLQQPSTVNGPLVWRDEWDLIPALVGCLVRCLDAPEPDTQLAQCLLGVLSQAAQDAQHARAIKAAGGVQPLLRVLGGTHHQLAAQAATALCCVCEVSAGDAQTLQQAATLELNQLRQQLREADAGCSARQEQLQTLLQQLDEAEAARFALQQQLQQAQDGRTELQQQLQQAQRSSAELQQQLQQAQRSSAKLQQQLQQAQRGITELQQQLQQAQHGRTKLQQQLQQAQCSSAELQQQLQQAQRGSAELQQQLQQAKDGRAELQQQLQQAQDGRTELQQQLQQRQAAASLRQPGVLDWRCASDDQLLQQLAEPSVAAQAVCELARRMSAGKIDLLQLLPLLDSRSAAAQEHAVFLLHHSFNPSDASAAQRMFKRGGAQKLTQLLTASSNKGVHEHAAAALARLASVKAGGQAVFVYEPAVRPLVALLQTSDSDGVRRCAAAALANMACDAKCAASICEAGGVRQLVQLLSTQNHKVQIAVLVALTNVSCHPDSKAAVRSAGGVEALVKLRSDNVGVLEKALSALTMLDPSPQHSIRLSNAVNELVRSMSLESGAARLPHV